jgi:hypothetical protein
MQPMTTPIRSAFCALALSALALAAGPDVDVSGEYVEARTADVYTGPCFANAEVQQVGNLAVQAWKINKGAWHGVNLDGLAVAAAVKAYSTLGDRTGSPYPVKALLIVDQQANLEQRAALRAFAQRMTGDLLQDIVRTEAVPIQFTVEDENIHARKVRLAAGTLALIHTRSFSGGDHLCSNEETWYDPLSKLDHAMPAYAIEHRFAGTPNGLRASWSSPDKRSAFVGNFHLTE